uniref:Mobile element protein n=1 Tax=Vibrio tasmaniensis TaxID=212663 RepID=A0A0H3ZVY2_9VIBR|nr:Mobile element protein [Vibrio tasmaniensis]
MTELGSFDLLLLLALLRNSVELNHEPTICSATSTTSHSPMPKHRHKTINWKQYSQSLINCGSLTFWIDEEVISG